MLQDKINYSIELIKKAYPMALQLSDKGFHLAFSGGKDSQVIYELCKMANVKFQAHMQLTTIDPPQVLKFIRRYYPDVILHRPPFNIYQLIVKKSRYPPESTVGAAQLLKNKPVPVL